MPIDDLTALGQKMREARKGKSLTQQELSDLSHVSVKQIAKIEKGETSKDALVREIKEELETEIAVGELIDTIEYDYPAFHLSMDCFWAEIVAGELILKEHKAAKWLTKAELDSVEWLPADIILVDQIRKCL